VAPEGFEMKPEEKCRECGGTGRKWFRLPDDVGSPHATPCPRGCPMEELPPVVIEVAPRGGMASLSNRAPGGIAEDTVRLGHVGIGVPQCELRGHVTIGVPQRSDGSEFVEIRVEDELSGATFAEIRVGLAEFARALAARRVECAFRLRGMDIVGRRHEHKTVDIRHPCPGDHAHERDGLLREAVAPHEVDGWVGDIDDFRNMHNRTDAHHTLLRHRAGEEVYRIRFVRYVDPAEECPATLDPPPKKRGPAKGALKRPTRGSATSAARGGPPGTRATPTCPSSAPGSRTRRGSGAAPA